MDLAPTILDAAGTAFQNRVHGTSLFPLCAGESIDWRDDLMCETHGHMEHHIGRLIVTDRFKYVANQGQMDELYDLCDDPYEMTNLIGDPAYREVLTDLKVRLSIWQKETHDNQDVLGD